MVLDRDLDPNFGLNSTPTLTLSRATDDHWTVSKPYAREAPAKTRVLIRQDHEALGGVAVGSGGTAASAGGGAAIGSDAPDGRMISSDRPPAARVRSPAAGEHCCGCAKGFSLRLGQNPSSRNTPCAAIC